ncbi:Ribonuclease P protein subunit p14 [Holothuria leucospilota]|uniref:Ribonuclease P protein subunit p14 n=1 Tax=Holothuria leucospilota TaxID=206669 RepID=A0A9Q1HHH9_HOLLE|nr:Ribonuclease P protein subunit p14 [Holothuria leucospilota]
MWLCPEETSLVKFWQKSCVKFTMDPKFERIVLKSGPFHYMKIKLDFLGAKANVDSDIFKSVIVDALSELHGDVGAAMSVDILYFDCETTEGIIRVPSKYVFVGISQNLECIDTIFILWKHKLQLQSKQGFTTPSQFKCGQQTFYEPTSSSKVKYNGRNSPPDGPEAQMLMTSLEERCSQPFK